VLFSLISDHFPARFFFFLFSFFFLSFFHSFFSFLFACLLRIGEVAQVVQLKSSTKAVINFLRDNLQCVVAGVIFLFRIWFSSECSGTVWGIRKSFHKEVSNPPSFQMIIIDEASQMLIADSVFAIKYLDPVEGMFARFCLRSCLKFSGRLVMAGDLHQLPPIISGDYSELPEG
jgi:hypothetical protein